MDETDSKPNSSPNLVVTDLSYDVTYQTRSFENFKIGARGHVPEGGDAVQGMTELRLLVEGQAAAEKQRRKDEEEAEEQRRQEAYRKQQEQYAREAEERRKAAAATAETTTAAVPDENDLPF